MGSPARLAGLPSSVLPGPSPRKRLGKRNTFTASLTDKCSTLTMCGFLETSGKVIVFLIRGAGLAVAILPLFFLL